MSHGPLSNRLKLVLSRHLAGQAELLLRERIGRQPRSSVRNGLVVLDELPPDLFVRHLASLPRRLAAQGLNHLVDDAQLFGIEPREVGLAKRYDALLHV